MARVKNTFRQAVGNKGRTAYGGKNIYCSMLKSLDFMMILQ